MQVLLHLARRGYWFAPVAQRFAGSIELQAGKVFDLPNLLEVLAETFLREAPDGSLRVRSRLIGYWQDLMQGRPGTAAALMALQRLAGDLLAAASFALGTAIGGYTTAALLGGGLAMAGAMALWIADRRA